MDTLEITAIAAVLLFIGLIAISGDYLFGGLITLLFIIGISPLTLNEQDKEKIENNMIDYIQHELYPNEYVSIKPTDKRKVNKNKGEFIVQSSNGTDRIEIEYIKDIDEYTHNGESIKSKNETTLKSTLDNTDKNSPNNEAPEQSNSEKEESIESFIKDKVFKNESNEIKIKLQEINPSETYKYYVKLEEKLFEIIVVYDENSNDYLYKKNEIDFD